MSQPSIHFTSMLHTALQFGYFVGLIALLGNTIVHRHRCPRPASLLIWAFSLMLFSLVTRMVLIWVLPLTLSVDQVGMGFQLVSVGTTIVSLAAMILIHRAVFADRPSDSPYISGHDAGGRPLAEQPSDNPYASPRR